MALLDSEVARIRYELGFPVLTVGAEPYIGIAAVFEQVIRPYLQAGASTTSSTPVTAASSPSPVTITVASATGIAAGARLVVDVDDRQEAATVQAISGTSVTLLLSLAHSGAYPVTVEGGETIVRDILRKLRRLGDVNGRQESALGRAGIKELVGDVIFFGNEDGSSVVEQLERAREYWRGELRRALFGDASAQAGGRGGGSVALY